MVNRVLTGKEGKVVAETNIVINKKSCIMIIDFNSILPAKILLIKSAE